MSSRTSRALALLAAAIFAFSLAACGSSGSSGADGERITIGASAVPSSLDPRRSAPFEAVWLGLLYDALLERGPDGSARPGLASSWNLSPDARTLDLTLRPGVRFQDGATLDAAAVKANLDASRRGGANFSAQLADVQDVEVLDPQRVRVTLAGSGAPMLGVLAGEAGMMISPRALATPNLTESPAGTGAFTLDRFAGQNLAFTRWDGYWNRQAVSLAGVDITVFIDESARVRALRSGQLDAGFVVPTQIPEVEAAGMRVVDTPSTDGSFYGVILNTGRPGLADPRVRQALMLATDRAAIARSVFGENGCAPSAQPYARDDWAYTLGLDELPAAQFDPARARALLAAASPGGLRVEMQLGTMQTYTQIGAILQEQWRAVGVDVVLRPMENVQFVNARRQGQFETTLSNYLTSRPDQSTFVKNFYVQGGLFNPAFAAPQVDELLARSSSTTDPAGRAAPMHELMTSVLEAGPPVLPICNRSLAYAMRSNVEDLDLSLNAQIKYARVASS